MNKRKILSKIAFGCSLALVLAIASLYLYNIIKWGTLPDYGFGFGTGTGVRVVRVVMEAGRKAGLEMGDRILKVNGKTITNFKEMHAVRSKQIGGQNTYLIERDGRQFEVVIKNTPLGFKESFMRSGFSYLVGLCYVLFGALVFIMKPHRRASWTFFLFCSILGLFFMFLYKVGMMNPFEFESLNIFAYTFAPAVFIHLALSFPAERNFLKNHPYAQLLPYVASALLLFYIRHFVPTMMDASKIMYIIFIAYFSVSVLMLLGSCLQLLMTSLSEIDKVRSKMMLLGVGISASVPLLDGLANSLFHTFIIPNFNYYSPFLIIFPIFVGYSIVKHNLFDIDAIIKRTYGYILTTGSIAGIYALFIAITNLAFGRFEITKSPIFPLLFILAVIFLFNPIRNRVQKFIDRVFYRLEYNYQETVQRISDSLRSLLSLDQIGKRMMDTAFSTMFINSGCILVLKPEDKVYEPLICLEKRNELGKIIPSQLPTTVLPSNDPFIQKMADRKKEVTIYDIQEDPLFEQDRETCKRAFNQLEAALIVPIVYEDSLEGLISLGNKKSGKFYRREDINLLRILANQGAVAIENARLFQENLGKQRMEEELNIARDLQMSMLPATCPQIKGFTIAATSIPAREVGGDFFDFIEMGEGRFGLVVGDVTGKSVSGALVMSSSRSVFRMLSEEHLTVGDIMIRANRRIKKDIKSGMFVALLYSVLDGRNKILSFCSAGQTHPIYFSSRTQEARLKETLGDRFPLGILDESDYRETRLELASGDRIVFYTDGIVEAMNEKEEIFGFERLLEVVQEARSMNADSLLKEILNKVSGFSGGAAQHDDLTVIVVAVD